MAITYNEMVSVLTGLTITGISSDAMLTAPPEIFDTARCPALFPRLPSGESIMLSFNRTTGRPHITIELVVLVQSDELDLAGNRFDNAVDLMDNINTALTGQMLTTTFSAGSLDGWTMQLSSTESGVEGFVSVIVTVEAS